MDTFIILMIMTALWVYGLILFKKTKMNFFKFLLGSIGFFTICMIFFAPFLEKALSILISDSLNVIGRTTGYFQVFKENSIVSFDTRDGVMSILIDYECSGIIEVMVFVCLAMFFPFGSLRRKVLLIPGGCLYIFLANIARILFIISATKTFGVSAFYLAHTLFGRLVFFGLMVILYYYTFTITHLKYQNVGEMR